MNKAKIAILVVVLTAIAIVFPARYLAENSGINTSSGDYGIHTNISEHIRSLDFFPSISQVDTGKHAVSKYLPIYHGLIGFHLLSLIPQSLGVPLPGSYLLIMDLSLLGVILITLFLLIDANHQKWQWESILTLFLIFPFYYSYFCQAVEFAYFSQLLSQSLIAIATYLYLKNVRRIAIVIFFYAILCYPDFLIWFTPIIFFKKISKTINILLGVFWLVLMWIPIQRGSLPGPLITSPIPVLAVICLVACFGKNLWATQKNLAIVSISFVTYTITISLATFKAGDVSYYAGKISSFSYLLLPYLVLKTENLGTLKGKVLLSSTVFFLFIHGTLWTSQSSAYLQGQSTFSNADYKKILTVKKDLNTPPLNSACSPETSYVIPHPDSDISTILANNGLLKNFDIYSWDLQSAGLNTIYRFPSGSAYLFFKELKSTSEQWPSALNNAITSKSLPLDFCLAAPLEISSTFAKYQSFEIIYVGEQFVYFKPKKP